MEWSAKIQERIIHFAVDVRFFFIFNPSNYFLMNIIVTGASRGIGAEIVKILAKHKGNHIVAISRNADGLRKLVADCGKLATDTSVMPAEFDLTHFDFYPFLLQKVEISFRHCDILINNAGKLINKTIEKMEHQDFDDLFNVNVKSPFFLIRQFLPMMSRGGHIVNISSMGGIQGSKKFKGLSLYSASKGALTVLTESLAEELNEKELAVNCLALGATQTEMFEKAFPGMKAMQTPQQIAQFIADFAVTGQKYFNGKVIPVSISVP
jgi:NAD(P)-dependent dehydrogenase (short-subunit alcohol dehydrogenase family)